MPATDRGGFPVHPGAALFLTRCHIPHPAPVVFEVGARDHNGRARDYLPTLPARWVGFDLLAGPGVDVVGDAAELLPEWGQCDVVVSTEVLEHCERWSLLLHRMAAAVRAGGWLVVTCAGSGREAHGADGGPLLPGEYYGNVSVDEVVEVVERHGFAMLAAEEVNGDTRYFGRKVGAGVVAARELEVV